MNEDKATRYHRLGRRASLLSTAWTLALLSGVMWSGASVGLRAWAGGLAIGRSHAVVVVFYVLVLPLFYRFKPLDKTGLRDRLTSLAARANTSIRGVYEWTLSDRTKKANAALTGLGNTRRILLSDTLLAEYSDDEIEVILAHE